MYRFSGIRKLQSILLKVCLILGVEIYTGVEFKKLLEPTDEHGWRAQFSPYKERLDKFVFDIVVGADGKKDMLPGFPQIEMRGNYAMNAWVKVTNCPSEETLFCLGVAMGTAQGGKYDVFQHLRIRELYKCISCVNYMTIELQHTLDSWDPG